MFGQMKALCSKNSKGVQSIPEKIGFGTGHVRSMVTSLIRAEGLEETWRMVMVLLHICIYPCGLQGTLIV